MTFSCSCYRLGADVDDVAGAGDGPGSYDVRQNVWHLNCCNPENHDGNGWTIFGALFGWSNNATLGSVLGYIFYWLAAVVALIILKFKEVNKLYFVLVTESNQLNDVNRVAQNSSERNPRLVFVVGSVLLFTEGLLQIALRRFNFVSFYYIYYFTIAVWFFDGFHDILFSPCISSLVAL